MRFASGCTPSTQGIWALSSTPGEDEPSHGNVEPILDRHDDLLPGSSREGNRLDTTGEQGALRFKNPLTELPPKSAHSAPCPPYRPIHITSFLSTSSSSSVPRLRRSSCSIEGARETEESRRKSLDPQLHEVRGVSAARPDAAAKTGSGPPHHIHHSEARMMAVSEEEQALLELMRSKRASKDLRTAQIQEMEYRRSTERGRRVSLSSQRDKVVRRKSLDHVSSDDSDEECFAFPTPPTPGRSKESNKIMISADLLTRIPPSADISATSSPSNSRRNSVDATAGHVQPAARWDSAPYSSSPSLSYATSSHHEEPGDSPLTPLSSSIRNSLDTAFKTFNIGRSADEEETSTTSQRRTRACSEARSQPCI